MIFKGPDIWKKWMAAIKDSKKEVDAIKSETSEQKQ
jgi:hypothetical protein